jgi:hypothetical protein
MGRTKRVQPVSPRILVGTGNEVGRLLHQGSAPRALAITFADDAQSAILEGVFRKVTAFLPQMVRLRQRETVEQIVGALLPDIAIPDMALAQARMMVDAKSTILESGDFLPAAEIAALAGYSAKNPSAQPNKWKKDGAIFAIQHKGNDYFPMYALDVEENYRPCRALAEVLRIFGETKTGWGIAFWFAGLNSFLDDRRPQDLLESEPDLVIAAARDEVAGIRHG